VSEAKYGRLADQIAKKHGLDPALFRRLIQAESGWRVDAGSSAGARGLTQLMPATARGLGVRNITDPRQNLEGGAKYLAQQLKTFGGDRRKAVAAYNAGPGAVTKYGGVPPYAETQGYVSKVLSGYQPGQASGAAAGAPPTPAAAPEGAQRPSIDGAKLLALLSQASKGALAGRMPSPQFSRQLALIARDASRAPSVPQVQAAVAPQAQQAFAGLTMGGGPSAHGSRALGNWQSDNAYDLMGKAGAPVPAYVAGVVTKISGKPGGDPGFAGYGITVRTKHGDLFFKHLGSANVKVGQKIKPGMILGTLDPSTAGGPHLHLGGTNRAVLDRLAKLYTRAGK